MFRWLLLSYPRDYRRQRGAEILDTVRDFGSARSSLRVSANLVRHGLRARLGRSASRSVVVWATMFSVACGLFAASFGTWVAWMGTQPPDPKHLATTAQELFPGRQPSHLDTHQPPSPFEIYGGPLRGGAVDDLLFGDGGEYSFTTIGAGFNQITADNRADALAQLEQRLRATGWTFSDPIYTNAYDCIPNSPCDPTKIPSDITVYAQRAADILEVHINAEDATPVVGLSLSRATPWTVYPAAIIGLLLGWAGAWMLFGWCSRRIEHRHAVVQAMATVLLGFTMFLWWTPILFVVPTSLSHHLGEPHYRFHPLWEWLGQPFASLLFLLGCAMLTMCALAALPGRRAQLPDPSTLFERQPSQVDN